MKTKKLIYLLAALLVSSISILQTGCKKDKIEEPPPSNPVVLKDNAKILDETAWVESFVSMDSSNYTYTFNTNIDSLNLAVGDLLASNAGNGCLRIVKSVTSAKGEVVVETEQGSMEDLFESGEVILDTPLDIEDIESVNFNYPGIKLIPNNLKQPDDLGFTIEFDIIFKGDTANPSGLVRIHGSSTFNFGLITQINYSVLSGLTYVKVGFESSQVLTLDFIAGVGYNEEINLGEVLFKKKEIKVAGATVPLKPKFELFLGVDLSGNIELNAVAKDSLYFGAGLVYSGKGWSPYCDFSNTFNFQPPEIGVSLEARGYLKPKMTLLIYGIRGPYAYAEGYLKARGQAPQIPLWALYAGYNLKVGAEAKIFGHYLFTHEETVLADETLLKKGPTPTVKTNAVTNIILATAKGGGDVTDEGSSSVTERGICWSTTHNPTIADSSSHSSSGGEGSYICDIDNLSPGTKYYIRAYATNSQGTDYGEEKYFTSSDAVPCPGTPTVTYEGQTYRTVLINNQCWFNENLNVGTMINVANDQANNGQIEKYCMWDIEDSCEVYGGLYQWDEMMQYTTSQGTQGICPPGWHIPTDAEWTSLTDYLGGESVAGGKMKEAGIDHWCPPNTGATNLSGFAALPGGIGGNGDFWDWSSYGYYWSSTQIDADNAWQRILSYNNTAASRDNSEKVLGFSVRCVKNN